MLFAHDGNVEKALINSILASLADRTAKACETWDLAKVLASAWGVKEVVEPAYAEAVKQYITSISGSNIEIEPGKFVTLLKGDVKEQKGDFILIYRYQLI